jgi:hypothetical protein
LGITLCVTLGVTLGLTLSLADRAEAQPAVSAVVTAGQAALSNHLVILYRKETAAAPNRLDPTVQAVTLALEHEFLNRQYQLIEPSADTYRAMDQGPGVIVTFAPDAGLSLVYSVYANLRPQPGTDVGIAEVRIDARVFVGSNLLAAEEGRGQIQTRTDPALKDYGERRGYEIAAQRAAMDLATRVDGRLKSLSPETIAAMMAEDATPGANFAVVTPPDAGTSSGTAASPSGPPAPAPNAVPAVATGKRWLLSVGVANYSRVVGIVGAGTHDNDLEGTGTDVKNVRKTLQSFGFGDQTTIQLFDQAATTKAVRDALARLSASVGPDDVAVFYISGHGMETNFGKAGVTLPIFYDTDLNTPPDSALNFAELVSLFSQVRAKQLVMLIDTCHSGGAAAQMTTVAITARSVVVTHSGGSPDVSRVLKVAKGVRGDIAVMSAARTDESAVDLGAARGGLFTSNLVKGLSQTQGLAPIEDVYKTYVWTAVRNFCHDPSGGAGSCEQSPVLGYGGAGNKIRLAAQAH